MHCHWNFYWTFDASVLIRYLSDRLEKLQHATSPPKDHWCQILSRDVKTQWEMDAKTPVK